MSAIVVRSRALDALIAALEGAVPELRGRISSHADRDERMAWPKLGVQLTSASFRPRQRERLVRLTSSEVVFEVGWWDVECDLRLGAPTARQRSDLAELVCGAFYEDSQRPGLLVQHLAVCHDAVAAWELDEDGWQDELAFDKKLFSVCQLSGRLPVLVNERVYRIDDLRLTLTEDMTTGAGAIPADAKQAVRVNEDGTFTTL